jgi:hypothetical protein
MKKVIAAAAGLMLVGAMAGTALGAVSMGGDARARFLYQNNYDLGETSVDEETGAVTRDREKDNKVTSRVRVQFRGEAAGGAYAVGRIGIGDGTWDGGNSGTNDVIVKDKAYIGVPMGMTLLEAGRQPIRGVETTKFFIHDRTADGLTFFINPNDNWSIQLGYYINYEAAVNGDLVDDNDISDFSIWVDGKFAGDWGTRFGTYYIDDQVPTDGRDDDGAYGGLELFGPAGPVGIKAAVAWDDRGEGDTGWAAFVAGDMAFGATTAGLHVGFANDGIELDNDYGFIMLGGGESITIDDVTLSFGEDTWWVGLPVSFAVSEALTLKANLAYFDYDISGDAFEISGSAIYAISDGASVDLDIGYLAWSNDRPGVLEEESPFGAGLTFNVSF